MGSQAELGAFLRSRRARLKPGDVGLTHYGERRRVPGLRREELAQLAGVSVDYYVRFEQGRSENVSDAVIDAVATALRLNEAEHAHLYNLARAVRQPSPPGRPPELRPGLRRLLDSMTGTPAFIVGRRTDILAWSPLFTAIIPDIDKIPPGQRNGAWLVFLNEEVRGKIVDWEAKARDIVALLRRDQGRHPGDPAFAALIDELSDRSPDFRRLWADHEVREKTHGVEHLHHPMTGEFILHYETFRSTGDPDLTLIAYTAEPPDVLRVLAEAAGAAKRGGAS